MPDPLKNLMLVPSLAAALADAGSAVDAIQLTARRRSGQKRADALAASAAASAAIDGIDGPLVASLIVELDQITLRPALLQGLARLHAMADTSSDRGRPRADFTESERLALLADLVANSSAPALLVASIAHAELLDMAPFAGSSGVIARAIWRKIIVESGLDPTGMVMIEVGLRDLGVASYRAALDEYRTATSDGVTAWVKHCARAVELGVVALRELLAS